MDAVVDQSRHRPSRPGYCRVTFDHPPINAITATTVAELAELVELIEADTDLNVVVFDSANRAFYLTHNDTENDPSVTASRHWARPESARGTTCPGVCPVSRWSASRRSVGTYAAPVASSCSPATCDSPHGRTPCSDRSRVERVRCPGAVGWAGSPGWRVEAARSRSSSRPTISMEREGSSTGTSTG